MWSSRVDPPEAAAYGDHDEGHEGDHDGAEVDVRVGKVRLLGHRFGLRGVEVSGLEEIPENIFANPLGTIL